MLSAGSKLDSKDIDTYMDKCDQARADKICFAIMAFVAGCGPAMKVVCLNLLGVELELVTHEVNIVAVCLRAGEMMGV